jgi:hypothetical protein
VFGKAFEELLDFLPTQELTHIPFNDLGQVRHDHRRQIHHGIARKPRLLRRGILNAIFPPRHRPRLAGATVTGPPCRQQDGWHGMVVPTDMASHWEQAADHSGEAGSTPHQHKRCWLSPSSGISQAIGVRSTNGMARFL